MSKHALPRANFRISVPNVVARDSDWGFLLGRLSQYLILMGLFIASSPIERRHTRQRIAEKPSRQVARLELGSAITIRQRQGTGPKARREHEVSGLAAASSFIQDFGHCSFPRTASPSRSLRARQHLGQRVTADCPN